MKNKDFLAIVTESFKKFLSSGSSRSTAKLKPLHGGIAKDLAKMLPDYTIKAQGYGNEKEGIITGRYMEKRVDITIEKEKIVVAGIAVKFIMQNYSQNSNNYFENMLGETANIRTAHCPYFQIFIILDHLPYYKNNGVIHHWETFTSHNIEKYLALSHDDTDVYFHTPNKTLIYVVHIPVPENQDLTSHEEYVKFYKTLKPELKVSKVAYPDFGPSIILNDYEKFINKVFHTICAQ